MPKLVKPKNIAEEINSIFINCPVRGCDWFGLTPHARNTHIGCSKDDAHKNMPLPPLVK